MHHVMDSVRHIYRNYPEDLDKAETHRLQVDYQDYIQYMTMEPDLVEFLEFLAPDIQAAISPTEPPPCRFSWTSSDWPPISAK